MAAGLVACDRTHLCFGMENFESTFNVCGSGFDSQGNQGGASAYLSVARFRPASALTLPWHRRSLSRRAAAQQLDAVLYRQRCGSRVRLRAKFIACVLTKSSCISDSFVRSVPASLTIALSKCQTCPALTASAYLLRLSYQTSHPSGRPFAGLPAPLTPSSAARRST